MERCKFCGKRVWFWQSHYLGWEYTAHGECDFREFAKGVEADALKYGYSKAYVLAVTTGRLVGAYWPLPKEGHART